MNNQLTKLENEKIVKKENVTEEQLVNRLYKYERLGTVGKIQSTINAIKYSDDMWSAQFSMARADVAYWKNEAKSYEERYNILKSEFNASIHFREINAGLKHECRKYKQLVESLQKEIEILKGKITKDES